MKFVVLIQGMTLKDFIFFVDTISLQTNSKNLENVS